MEVSYGLADFEEAVAGVLFFEALDHLDLFVERAFLHVLHEDVDVVAVGEEAVHPHDVGVAHEEADLYLLHELLQHVPYRLLSHLLYRQQSARSSVDCWVDFAESAFALTRTQLEILEAQLNGLAHLLNESWLAKAAQGVGLAHDALLATGDEVILADPRRLVGRPGVGSGSFGEDGRLILKKLVRPAGVPAVLLGSEL